MIRAFLAVTAALVLSSCGAHSTVDDTRSLADSVSDVFHDGAGSLADAAPRVGEILKSASDSGGRAIVKTTACSSLAFYGRTGLTPSVADITNFAIAAAQAQAISFIPTPLVLELRNDSLNLVAAAEQVASNGNLDPSQASAVITGEIACTLSNFTQ
jgi:hypothetical protein